MDQIAQLPDDFFVTSSQFTKTVYRDSYPELDVTQDSFSQKGKVIIITGASQGLGREAFAASFAKAGAKAIVLVARNAQGLEATSQDIKTINPDISVLVRSVDIRDQGAVRKLYADIKSTFGTADVLINNAGCGKSALPMKEIDAADFWYDFEVNVKGALLMTQEFLRLVGATKPATIINITSAAAIAVIPTTSSYSLSKLVQVQMQRFVAVENPNIVAVSLHPGGVLTSITKPAFVRFSSDTFALAGGVAVWLATEQARFMNGRYMGVNWSVGELVERREEIVEKALLFVELQGSFGKAQFEK
ncbi:putative oxidoreductase ucpA [Rhexocercosporidium sp. MPI-PUGE-AT-0058]|nr:putative oxidoreductase ucpA [Rhexocercosporidium sp. MPI-PUGE-AT-0058]